MKIRNNKNRQGITLVFVVSMIVLFLLLGTTFVIISNDYFKASRIRAKAELNTIDREALVHRAFYDAVRGPSLLDKDSPLRTHDLLSDQYGYGFRGYINGVDDTNTTDDEKPTLIESKHFVRVTLRAERGTNAGDENRVWELQRPDAAAANDLVKVSRIYNGLVFSFTSGPAKGMSTRIVNHFYDITSGHHYFVITPTWLDTGLIDESDLVDSEIVINSRDFSGTGAGGYASGSLTKQARLPNRVGEEFTDLETAYFSNQTSAPPGTTPTFPNESYDAPDFQNMYLSGRDSDGDIIPSFHRSSLYDYEFSNDSFQNPDTIRRYTFQPFLTDLDNDMIPDPGSTANYSFPHLNPNELVVDNDNDGELDSVFIDPGYGILTDREGKRFKPLVAYHIVDLDGRLNLNAHGNWTQVNGSNNYISTSVNMLGGATNAPRGEGYGPAEVSLAGLFAAVPADYASLLSSRYANSFDNNVYPGDGGVNGNSLRKLIGHPVGQVDWTAGNFGTVNRTGVAVPDQPSLFASSAMNIHGRLAIGIPAATFVAAGNNIDDFRDQNYPAFTNGLPVIDMLASSTTLNEFDAHPYEMSFGRLPNGDPFDHPFTAAELERVLRQYDVDSNVLPERLWNVAQSVWSSPDNRNLVTTESYEVPMTHVNFKAKIMGRVAEFVPLLITQAQRSGRADLMIADNMFAPELLLGLKMDVNRPLGNGYDDDNDGVVDNPDEADNSELNRDDDFLPMDLNHDGFLGSESNARELFARHLYMLALVLTDPVLVDLDGDGTLDADSYERMIAQWAVNVVDFRDPDSIMTRFQFDVDPWDGEWNDRNHATSPIPLDDSNTVWGCERPELLISETVAVHPRRTEDLSTDPSGDDVADGDQDFDQGLRPEPFAFIELYNPWTQNSLNQTLPSSLYDTTTQGVELDRVTVAANGDRSPVWRIAIDRPDRGATPSEARTMRYVYFVDPDIDSDAIDDDDGANVEVFFPDSSAAWNPPATLRPGAQALIGSLGFQDSSNADRYRSFMGRLAGKTEGNEIANNLELDTTQHIAINPMAGEVTRYPADPTNNPRYSVVLPIDLARLGTKNSPAAPRDFSVSDAFEGYSKTDSNGDPYVEIVDGDGYRYTVPHDEPLDHPRREDSNRNIEDMDLILADEGMSANFRTINLQRLANPLLPWHDTDNPYITIDVMEMDLIAFNGVTADPAPEITNTTNPDRAEALERGVEGIGPLGAESEHRDLWRSERDAIANGTAFPLIDPPHYFNFQLTETLGKTNESFTNAQAIADGNGFTWLTWNNRPYVSHLEIANVPFTEPNWLTRTFTTKDNSDPYAGTVDTIRGRFHHLLNFFTNDDDSSGGDRANLYRLMDYLEVPSRFLGTEQRLNPANFPSPFDTISRYRVPGKINLNTIYDAKIWAGLQRDYAGLGCSFTDFQRSREFNSGSPMPTDFGNPFRPGGEGKLVPPGVPSVTGPGSTLFRNDEGTPGSTGDPLFDFANTNAAYNSNRSAYFRNAQRQRLGNLVTTRSSVFAVWITIAYFEVDEQGRVGFEVGSDTGEVTRNRGFYIFDRSIPMAFEPGKNHNVERGILVQSIIE